MTIMIISNYAQHILKNRSIFYFCNLVLVIFYLYPGSIFGYFLYSNIKIQPQLTADFIISSNHFYVFCLISIIGFLTYRKSEQIKFFNHLFNFIINFS
jgi:hypothetical protein